VGGGRGGTGGLSASVRRTVDEPETRKALAGKAAGPPASALSPSRPFGPFGLSPVG